MSSRTAARIAWSALGLCLVLISTGWLLTYLAPEEFRRQALYLTTIFVVLQLVFPTVGAFVASRRPDNPIGWLFCVVGLVVSTQIFADSYALFGHPGSLPGVEVMAWISDWIVFPVIMPVGALLFLLFPDGRLLTRRWRFVVWAAVAGGILLALADALMPGPLWVHPLVTNPFGVGGVIGGAVPAYRVWETFEIAGLWLLLVSCLVSAVSLTLRLHRAEGEERQQIKWFASAAALMVTGLPVGFWTEWGPINEISFFMSIFGFCMLPVTAGIAILRYRLWDIDIIINRALVYGALTTIVVGIYVLIVGYLGMLFQTGTGGNLTIPVLTTGLVAVLFQPLRARLQRGVNRLTYGERDDPYTVVSRLGQRLEATLAPEAALRTIVETTAQALKLPYAAIALKQDYGEVVTAAEYGTPVGEPVALPLTYQKEPVGQMLLAPRAPGETFSPSDRRLLEDLARQAGVALHATRLTADLQHSRERLVTAREEERRRLRRDLHDGLGPQLASLTLKHDAARNLLTRDPAATDALLVDLKTQTQDAISDIRRLVYDLRPPALDELGLVSAIREQATRYAYLNGEGDANGLTVSVEALRRLPPLPAAVEVACFRIAQEAVTNVTRHARASVCGIRLSIDEAENEFELEVLDDGVGLPAERRVGVGLASMRERAAELGGSCVIEPGPAGGTRVLARLPLSPSEERTWSDKSPS